MNTGKIVFEDVRKHQFVVVVRYCHSIQSVAQIADFLASKSDAAVISYSLTEEIFLAGIANDGGAYDRVEQQLKLLYRTDSDTMYFYIPAPKESVVTAHQEASATLAAEVKTLLTQTTDYENIIYKGGGLMSQYPFESGSADG